MQCEADIISVDSSSIGTRCSSSLVSWKDTLSTKCCTSAGKNSKRICKIMWGVALSDHWSTRQYYRCLAWMIYETDILNLLTKQYLGKYWIMVVMAVLCMFSGVYWVRKPAQSWILSKRSSLLYKSFISSWLALYGRGRSVQLTWRCARRTRGFIRGLSFYLQVRITELTCKCYNYISNIVVTKLVQRGYQPHLEDFLLRLNFNLFYKL